MNFAVPAGPASGAAAAGGRLARYAAEEAAVGGAEDAGRRGAGGLRRGRLDHRHGVKWFGTAAMNGDPADLLTVTFCWTLPYHNNHTVPYKLRLHYIYIKPG